AFPLAHGAMILVLVLFQELLARLLLLPPLVRRLGAWGGGAVVVVLSAVFFSPLLPMVPYAWGMAVSGVFAAAMVFLFLRYDLLTTLLAALTAQLLPACLVLLHAHDPALQLQGWLPLLAAAAPMLVGLRFVTGEEELIYRYDDVPPHVRRIAERERQRLELQTARGIQSSILPDLPPSLAGVDIAHAYRPATEVGGDFYDVLELEDGRLAVAVGDVAGHGVSSGLIMSMTKSALAVQVAYDPEVAPVFATLNRMVYQSARRRLLTTLCYALVDPQRRQVLYASAGHLFPYRIRGADGPEPRIEALESVAYPLGARPILELRARSLDLEAGDFLFLFSDGLVEAQAQGSDEVFGFQRLERSLASHAHRGVTGLRDGIFADLGAFAAGAPRHDDQTVLVLRLP
ncbi:MAG: PP2C family protein-serine/threonine phosphatase, partial [Acidobacteriota bacterium]|nr:PP2C family protein-serine/threonine phosphatase [Acidobacteriota bacterium]